MYLQDDIFAFNSILLRLQNPIQSYNMIAYDTHLFVCQLMLKATSLQTKKGPYRKNNATSIGTRKMPRIKPVRISLSIHQFYKPYLVIPHNTFYLISPAP